MKARWSVSLLLVGLGLALSAPSAMAQQPAACPMFPTPLPVGQACPPIAYPQWWVGTWVSRQVDNTGARLTGYTRLRSNGQYNSTIVYDDGRRIEQWGTYRIQFAANFAQAFRSETVAVPRTEAQAIDNHLTGLRERDRVAYAAMMDPDVAPAVAEAMFPTPLPTANTVVTQVAYGTITYNIQGFTPSNYRFASPQVFNFVSVADGHVRSVGTDGVSVLSRRYSRQ